MAITDPLTPEEAKALRIALIFGVPDSVPQEIATARAKLRVIEEEPLRAAHSSHEGPRDAGD